MNYSPADILGIIVDGGTIVYVSYKTGHRVWKNREDLIRRGQRLRVTVADRLHLSDRQTQVLTGGGIVWTDLDLIFPTATGAPMRASAVTDDSFKPLLERAGLPHSVRFHNLRHTCATLLLARGVHPKRVQELLGNSSIALTMDRYSHVIPPMGEQTTAAMDAALS
jgi:integrase